MQTLLKDLRFGLRSLLKRRGFTMVAVTTLALGIGATTAIFSVVDGLLLRPLPYRDDQRLVMLGQSNRKMGVAREGVSPANYSMTIDQVTMVWHRFPVASPNRL